MNRIGERYSLTGEIGRGGMAVVHRARDIRHSRDVAVKVMLPAVAESVGAERFLREIGTVARLQHPHIVPVFDSGDVDGQLYFVMPLIQGESLRDRLHRGGRLEPEEAVRLVREIADALDYAHGEGVVHRDVKPENILISRGHALLADFGVARARATGSDDDTVLMTGAGMLVGTPAYMSPEQVSADSPVGPASDVYALGCVLFELLTGSTPFQGDSYSAILVKRCTTDAPRVRALRRDVPAAYDEAVAAALERDPARRLPTARAFADALAAGTSATSPAASVGDRSIAVLPFANLSPDPNDAYLADGLAEELITDLSRINALRVIARNSSVAAHQRTQDLKEVARILDVRYLLEGSVRRAGRQLRITAQLIDGTTDSHLWAEKYGGTIDDVFEMQERISGSIVEELRARLTDEERADRAAPATDAETYEIYLRARHMLGQSLMRLPDATPLLEEVMRRSPGFAPAYCALGSPLVISAFFGYIEPTSAWERIQSLADRALAADPRSGPAHALQAAVATFRDWNWAEADRLYRRAAELEPGANFDHFMHAFFLAFRGESAAARRAAQTGRRLDPLGFMGFLTESVILTYVGEYEAALPLAERPIELDPQFPEGYHIAGYIHLSKHEYTQALARLERAIELSHRASWPVAKSGCALVGLGRLDEARERLDELERRAESDPTVCAPAIATLHLHLGDHDAFYRWMHRALDVRDPYALCLLAESLWGAARDEPRYRELLERVNLAP